MVCVYYRLFNLPFYKYRISLFPFLGQLWGLWVVFIYFATSKNAIANNAFLVKKTNKQIPKIFINI